MEMSPQEVPGPVAGCRKKKEIGSRFTGVRTTKGTDEHMRPEDR